MPKYALIWGLMWKVVVYLNLFFFNTFPYHIKSRNKTWIFKGIRIGDHWLHELKCSVIHTYGFVSFSKNESMIKITIRMKDTKIEWILSSTADPPSWDLLCCDKESVEWFTHDIDSNAFCMHMTFVTISSYTSISRWDEIVEIWTNRTWSSIVIYYK